MAVESMDGLHAMVDIEALGTTQDCVIASIGLTAWSVGTVSSDVPRDEKLLLNVANQPGRTVMAETALWWLRQSKEAQDATFGPGMARLGFREALGAMYNWGRGAKFWWSWPSLYDLAILDHAYRQAGMETPWSRKNLCCARTFCKAVGIRRPANPLRHDPLEDARVQAIAVQAALGDYVQRVTIEQRRAE